MLQVPVSTAHPRDPVPTADKGHRAAADRSGNPSFSSFDNFFQSTMATSRALRYGAAMATAAILTQPIVRNDDKTPAPRRPVSAILRAYAVYTACSIPALVDASPKILSTMGSIPGLSTVTEAVVRRTFYAQVRSRSRLTNFAAYLDL